MSPPMIRTLCLGMSRTRKDSAFYKVVMFVSSLPLLVQKHRTIVAQELPLDVAHIILDWIFSMLFYDF